MNRSRLAIVVLLLLAIAIAVVLAVSKLPDDRGIQAPPSIEPRPILQGTVERDPPPPEIDDGDDAGSEDAPPEDDAQHMAPATDETPIAEADGGGNLPGGNLPPRDELPLIAPPEVEPDTIDEDALERLKGQLLAVVTGDLAEAAARDALIRSLPELSAVMDDELALSLAAGLDRFLDPSLDKRVIALREVYEYPLVRQHLRERTDPGVVAAVIRQESRMADESAIGWLEQSQLVAPSDVFHGVTRYLSVVGTLIKSADPTVTPDCDARIATSLRRIRKLLAEGGDIDLRDVVAPKLEGLSAERLVTYEALFDE